jgi:hypothetical protein
MNRPTVAAVLSAALLGGVAFSTQASAATFTVFGPKDYARTTGKPIVATDHFSVANPGSFYVLHVYNGGKTGASQARASSAAIGLNGVEVVGPAAFNQQVWHIEQAVELLPSNELTVELRSKPNSGITVEIVGIDNDPSTIVAIVSPPPNPVGWNNTDVTVRFECAGGRSRRPTPAAGSRPVPRLSQ